MQYCSQPLGVSVCTPSGKRHESQVTVESERFIGGEDEMGEEREERGGQGEELSPLVWFRMRIEQQLNRHKTATLQILVWIPTTSESYSFGSRKRRLCNSLKRLTI